MDYDSDTDQRGWGIQTQHYYVLRQLPSCTESMQDSGTTDVLTGLRVTRDDTGAVIVTNPLDVYHSGLSPKRITRRDDQ